MAEDIKQRRLATEIENLNKIDSTKISVEKTNSNFDNSTIFKITFNLKDHPYNPRLLYDESELSLMQDAEADHEHEGDHEESKISGEEYSDDEPVDEWEDKEYHFDLIVPSKFPFMFPELRVRSDFSSPSLLDERDLLEDMLGKQWHPFIILKDIVERVPQYVYKIKKREKEGTLYYTWNSNYWLNSIYDLTLFKQNPEVWKPFVCSLLADEELVIGRKKKKTEEIKRLEQDAANQAQAPRTDIDCIDRVDDDKFKKYIIIVSDNSLLLFERPPFEKKDSDSTQLEVDPADLKFTMGKLVLWGSITSIEQLKRNMEFKDNISIVWTKPVKNEDDFEFSEGNDDNLEDEVKDDEPLERVYETRVEIPNSDDFMMVVLGKMQKIKENTNELKKKKILSMEVSWDSIKNKNITGLIHQIQVFEKEFSEKKTREIAQDLMDLYKKVIEYYSALENPLYKAYVHKNHELMMKLEDLE